MARLQDEHEMKMIAQVHVLHPRYQLCLCSWCLPTLVTVFFGVGALSMILLLRRSSQG